MKTEQKSPIAEFKERFHTDNLDAKTKELLFQELTVMIPVCDNIIMDAIMNLGTGVSNLDISLNGKGVLESDHESDVVGFLWETFQPKTLSEWEDVNHQLNLKLIEIKQ